MRRHNRRTAGRASQAAGGDRAETGLPTWTQEDEARLSACSDRILAELPHLKPVGLPMLPLPVGAGKADAHDP